MVRIGDRVQARLPMYSETGEDRTPKVGTVIYVHPKGRFCRVRFQLRRRPATETFQIVNGRIQDAKVL